MDILVLNSGEWLLAAELAASPWYLLIYRDRSESRNELHLWLPRADAGAPETFACKRYWMHAGQRWCIEAPQNASRLSRAFALVARIRFTSDEGSTLWVEHPGTGLADLSERDLRALFANGSAGSYSGL